MDAEATTEALLRGLEGRGYRASMVSAEHVSELREELERRHSDGAFNEEFYQEWLTSFKFDPPETLPEARTIIIVAVPQPQDQLTFNWNHRRLSLIAAPTFLFGREVNKGVKDVLSKILAAEGYRVASAVLPLKPLAGRSGLAAYGRNNITYVAGMGSFHRLTAFYSDLPCVRDAWQEPRLMESCRDCSACARACPSGAITPERFILRAELCVDFHKERPADYPGWLDPAWHDCLFGCMHCQRACPQNQQFLNWIVPRGEFSERETAMLLDGVPLEKLPSAMIKKLERLDLADTLEFLARDLRIFVNRPG